MNKTPGRDAVIHAAHDACKDLAKCVNFFNFEQTDSWLGWENWLTVDIVRRLDHQAAVRFCPYPNSTTRSDLVIRGHPALAVEIKVNYIDDDELQKWISHGSHPLPPRIVDDLAKLDKFGKSCKRLMLCATGFDSQSGATDYRKLIKGHLTQLTPWKAQWIGAGRIQILTFYKACVGAAKS